MPAFGLAYLFREDELFTIYRETEEELADVKEQLPWWKKKRKKKLKLYYYKKHWWKSDKFKENVVMGIMLAGYICVVWWLFKWSLG